MPENQPTPFELPAPQELPREGIEDMPGSAAAPEKQKTPPAALPGVDPPTLQTQPTGQPVTSNMTDDSTGKSGATVNDDNPLVADDVDVLEKEWVRLAKRIVENSKNDPYRQKKDMSAFKADYMKKRYGKEIGTQ